MLRQLTSLRQISLKGSPLSEQPGYRERMVQLVPQLEVLDNQRIAERPRKRRAAEVPAPGQELSPAGQGGKEGTAAAGPGGGRQEEGGAGPQQEGHAAMLEMWEKKKAKRPEEQPAGNLRKDADHQTHAPSQGPGSLQKLPEAEGQQQAAAKGGRERVRSERKVEKKAKGELAGKQRQQPGPAAAAAPQGGSREGTKKQVARDKRRPAQQPEAQAAASKLTRTEQRKARQLEQRPEQVEEQGLPASKKQKKAVGEQAAPGAGSHPKQPPQQGQRRQQPAARAVAAGTDSDSDADDAVAFAKPAQRQKLDAKKTGVLKVIDVRRERGGSSGRKKHEGKSKPGPSSGGASRAAEAKGAAAVQALLRPAQAAAVGLGPGSGASAWD